jgi:hypothetical protein
MKVGAMNDVERVSDADLRTLVLSTKSGILKAIDRGRQSAEPFYMGVQVLEIFEKELRRRGFDPTDKAFGRDIIGEIVQVKLEDAS